MARTRSTDYEKQRNDILSVAERAFAESGYPSSSIATLARACGTSKSRLYHYYPTKQAILADMLDRYTLRLIEITTRIQAHDELRGGGPREELAELIRAFLDEFSVARYRHAALLNDVRFLDDSARRKILDRERAIEARFADTLTRAFPGQVCKSNVRTLTMMLFGMINWTFTWMRPDDTLSYREFAEQVIRVFSAGVAALNVTADGSDTSGTARLG